MNVKAPLGLGELSVSVADASAARHPDLDTVIRYINRSSPPPKSYLQDDLEPGEWMTFEALLSYKFRRWGDDPYAQAVLLFWEPKFRQEEEEETRLLLHGSPSHLIGSPIVPDTEFSFSYGPVFAEWLIAVSEDTSGNDEHGLVEMARTESPMYDLVKYTGQVLRDLDRGLPAQRNINYAYQSHQLKQFLKSHELSSPETTEHFGDRAASYLASWMGGYARVTTVLNLDPKFDTGRVVVASPLFVEQLKKSSNTR
jgi:hypothetical protein